MSRFFLCFFDTRFADRWFHFDDAWEASRPAGGREKAKNDTHFCVFGFGVILAIWGNANIVHVGNDGWGEGVDDPFFDRVDIVGSVSLLENN